MASPTLPQIDRRTLLIGGGAGIGLIVAWQLWPRRYRGNLTADKGETLFGAWLKIGDDGRVTVAVPQVEHGQGVYTALPQIVAEIGGSPRGLDALAPDDLTQLGDDYLAQYSPTVQAAVKDYVAGKSMPTGNPRGAYATQIKAIAQKYGNEFDAQIGLKTRKVLWTVKYADYQAKGFGVDTKKFWLQAEYSF